MTPPQPVGQRRHLRLAGRGQRPRRVPAHAAHVPLQRLGHALRPRRHGRPQVVLRKVDGAEILRRVDAPRRDPLCGAPAVVAIILDAARDLGRRDPGPGPDPHDRGRRPTTHPDHRADRDRAGLGVHPDLRPHRDGAAAHHEPLPGRVGPPLARRAGPQAGPPGCPGARHPYPHRRRGRDPGPGQRGAQELLGPTRGDRRRRWTADGSTPATAAFLDEDSYLTIADRKKDVIISGGENVSSIEVEDCLFCHPDVAEVAVIGVPDDKWGETVKALVVLADGTELDEASLIEHCRSPPGPLQVPHLRRAPRRAGPHRHRQAPEVQAAGPLLGGQGQAGQLTGTVTAPRRWPACRGAARRTPGTGLADRTTARSSARCPAHPNRSHWWGRGPNPT